VAQDGTVYGAELDGVYTVDPNAGARRLAALPPGLVQGGDLAFAGGKLYGVATRGGGDDFLYEVDTHGGATRLVGPTNQRCIHGMATFGATLYGLTCTGTLVTIDVATGSAKVTASFENRAFAGATAW
jgi:hypothetical protein